MSKIALLFAGQGSQYQNMGLDFIKNNPSLEYYLERANKILGYDVKEVLNKSKGYLSPKILANF